MLTLYQGDSLAILRTLPDASIDAIITDPPYSSGGQFRGDRMAATSAKYQNADTLNQRPEFSGDNRDQRAYAYWCTLWLGECLRIAKPGAPICLFTDWRQLPTTTDALQAGGWIWRGIVPWDKTEAARPQKGRFRAQCEYVVWGSHGPMPDPPAAAPCLPGYLRVVVNSNEKRHIAGKPAAVLHTLVQICPPGGIILDPFMGSGTTGEGALQEGYGFIGIELDPLCFASTQAYLTRLQPALRGPVLLPVTQTALALDGAA